MFPETGSLREEVYKAYAHTKRLPLRGSFHAIEAKQLMQDIRVIAYGDTAKQMTLGIVPGAICSVAFGFPTCGGVDVAAPPLNKVSM